MSKIISFAWTSAALVNGAKTVTRRPWNPDYAATFHKGDVVTAYDRSPRVYGKPIAIIRLTAKPTWEPDRLMPDSDYEAEGFAWLAEHQDFLTPAAKQQARVATSRKAFNAWKREGGFSWVVRFELLEVLPDGIRLILKPSPQGLLFK